MTFWNYEVDMCRHASTTSLCHKWCQSLVVKTKLVCSCLGFQWKWEVKLSANWLSSSLSATLNRTQSKEQKVYLGHRESRTLFSCPCSAPPSLPPLSFVLYSLTFTLSPLPFSVALQVLTFIFSLFFSFLCASYLVSLCPSLCSVLPFIWKLLGNWLM